LRSLFDFLVVSTLPLVPKFIVGRIAARYVAGETLEDALRVIRHLNEEGTMAFPPTMKRVLKWGSRQRQNFRTSRQTKKSVNAWQKPMDIKLRMSMCGSGD